MRTGDVIRLSALVLGIGLVASVTAQEDQTEEGSTNAAAPGFEVIWTKNIFNPNRTARREERRTVEPERRPDPVESFALLGTLGTEEGWVAFFDGSDSAFRKALRSGATIGGCEIVDIQGYQVTLKSGDQEWRLPVGMELRRQGDQEWRLSERSESTRSSVSRSGSSIRSSSGSAGPESSGGSGGGDEDSEILRRLLERRQQENE